MKTVVSDQGAILRLFDGGRRAIMVKVLVAERVRADLWAAMIDLVKDLPVHLTCVGSGEVMELINKVANVDVLITFRRQIGESVLRAGKRLRLVQCGRSTPDLVDVHVARGLGVDVAVVRNVGAISVAEHAMALILGLAKKLIAFDSAIRRGENPRGLVPVHTTQDVYAYNWLGDEGVICLDGRVLGIVGLGEIGKALVRLASGFGMEIVYYKRHRLSEEEEMKLGVRYAKLDDLVSVADFIVLTVPLTPETEGMIGEAELGKMKNSAFLINVSRGAVVDEEALINALRRGRIAGAGLDVFRVEPLLGSPLMSLPNVILTPHSGAAGLSLRRAAEVLENVRRLARGEPLVGLVTQ